MTSVAAENYTTKSVHVYVLFRNTCGMATKLLSKTAQMVQFPYCIRGVEVSTFDRDTNVLRFFMDLLNFAKQSPRNASRFEIQKLETAKSGTEVLQPK
jgi:hypothetical protein